eukprot:TRINITY_DN31686_c0_g1_i1.p1 TRINITY_DN31686_c0_g1~~TRINITY_DN31686_c0_g1_i1.p1  ORF type:complete len:282 (-),score=52.65 TRINITY_DN31686_c0_g1_i1:257-1102(-)
MGRVRKHSCAKEALHLNKGPWSPDEDLRLCNYIKKHGHGHWSSLPIRAGLLRCGKSCRLRWMNYLRPNVKRGHISADEEDLIIRLHRLLGNRWALIAGRMPGRTDNEIKNYWNTYLKKKFIKHGIDPVTHKPFSNSSQVIDSGFSSPEKSKQRGKASEVTKDENPSGIRGNELHCEVMLEESFFIKEASASSNNAQVVGYTDRYSCAEIMQTNNNDQAVDNKCKTILPETASGNPCGYGQALCHSNAQEQQKAGEMFSDEFDNDSFCYGFPDFSFSFPFIS